MRLFSWAGAPCLLPVLVLLTVLSIIRAHEDKLKERHYYIAAVQIDWDYSGDGPQRSGHTHKKVVFREYERGFKQAKTHPSWLGLLGPTLRGQVGEVVVVTFRNMADRPYSIHPHGIAYGKQSEGAQYFDNTSQKEKEDDVVPPNREHTYYWELTSDVAPQINDPDCLTYTYMSHFSTVQDYNTGLVGALLICKPGSLDELGEQFRFHHEYVFLFGVFDERQSWYRQGHGIDNQVKYTINGYTSGSLPDVSICAHSAVSLHLMGMNSEPEVFSVHMNGQVFQQNGHKVSSVGLVSGAATTASLTAVHPGRWMLSSHTTKHLEAGLHGFVDVKFCAGFMAPEQRLTIQQRRESKVWKYYIAAEEIIWNYAPNMPDSIDKDFKLDYLTPGLNRIGGKYRKALYTQYTDDTFTVRAENQQRKDEVGILGPVIRAQIRDVIKIYFKNMASRPYSIYPHGLTIEKSQEGVNYPAGGNQTHGVQPGQTHIYTWKVVEQDEPLDGDSRCLTRMYHSAVDTPRDIASGLVGPILICKSQSLNVRNVQLKSDKEQHAMFAVFDENKSWYLDKNIRTYSDRTRVNKADPDFYKSNVMHTINGYVFESGQTLGFCNGEIATWHMSSIGAQDYIQTATFYGHTFELNERTEDFLSLFPMTGETISMNMDNVGIWLLASLNSHETTKGMRVKFRDVECFRDYQYEYTDTDYEETGAKLEDFTVWKPPSSEEEEKEEVASNALMLKNKKEEEFVVDDYTALFADELGLRSHKNKSQNSDMEELDLSGFDYGVSGRGVDATVKLRSAAEKGKNGNDTAPSEPESNSTVDSEQRKFDGSYHSTNTLLNQSIGENQTQTQNSTASGGSIIHNISVPENITRHNTSVLLRENNITEAKHITRHGSSVLEDKRINLTQTGVNQSSVNMNQGGDSEERITRGDVFYYAENDRHHNNTEEMVLLDVRMGSASDNETMKEDLSSGSLSTRLLNTTIHNVSSSFTIDNITTETSNVTATLSGHSSSVLEDKSVNQSSANMTQGEDSEDKITGGDVLTALNHTSNTTGETGVPDAGAKTESVTPIHEDPTSGQHVLSAGNVSLTAVSTIENVTVVNHNATFNISKDVENHSWSNSSAAASHFNTSNTDNFNLTSNEGMVEGSSNMTNVHDMQDTTVGQEYGNPSNSSSEETNSSVDSNQHENNMSVSSNESTAPVWNDTTVGQEYGNPINSSSEETNSSVDSNQHENNMSVSSNESTAPVWNSPHVPDSSSEEGSDSDSGEDVVMIYLQNNSSEAIITTSLHSQEHNWTYNGSHQTVPMELPDHMIKYISNDPPKSTAPPTPTTTKKPKRTVNRRQWPKKGHAMKTRRRTAHKPQARTGLPFSSGLPSPRGLNPGMSPRGSRPASSKPRSISSKEDLINTPVVIGVPRPDFRDYQLYVPGEDPDHLNLQDDVKENEYEYVSYIDPYSSHKEITLDETTKYYLKTAGTNVKTYFISAEEVVWDYGGYGHRRQEKSLQSMEETKFTKVVFRQYLDSDFTTPDIRGELEEHLGILGPLIKAEVGQSILVIFRNKASRPFSLHPNGVTYTKQAEGLEYDDESKYWYKYDNEVQPNTTFTYLWKVPARVGPSKDESACRTWAYYSGVNPERDIHSGLIGPLLVCREGTLRQKLVDMREFVLLFMTFDETRSWYYDRNREMMERTNQRAVRDPNFRENLKFHSINGILYSLKGLRMYTDQMVRWHLLNMGSQRDVHSVYFHGQTFLHKQTKSYRQAVFPLLPGGFATLEMKPSKPGLWQLETEVGFNQQNGMQTLFLVLDKECYYPLGLSSGSVKDNQITANHTRALGTFPINMNATAEGRGSWVPHLARLNNQGKYNAWSTEGEHNWIQVDFLRPVVISQVATQGARQMMYDQYVTNYTVSYSTDRRKWIYYKGDSNRFRKIFPGNQEAYETKVNTFFPPLIGRFIRLHPIDSHKNPTLRMEFYGCELDGCSVPLGMESRLIEAGRIKASSTATSWYSGPWKPSLARLNMQGTINAWQAKTSNMYQWLQVELAHVKKITGIITQGAKAIGTEMYVISYALQYSNDGIHWNDYTDDPEYTSKTFNGNTDNNGHVKNYIYPPIFSRFVRILPRSWRSSITMRIELLGCDFE